LPSHVCQIGEEPGAFFESEAEVEYEVCVTFPSAETLCAEEQLAEEETLYVNEITTDVPGTHLVTWYVEGVEVAAWSFRMDPVPPVTPPVTTPPVSTPPVTTALPPPAVGALAATPAPESKPSSACLSAKQQISKLGRQLSSAKSAKRKSTIRKALNKARTAKTRSC
jgi:hypothetical protein